MARVDVRAPLRFLRVGYKPDDWIAVFLKSYETGQTAQRVGPLSLVTSPQFQAWLRSPERGALEHLCVGRRPDAG